MLPAVDPWGVELIVVTGAGMTGGERRSISRDVERGLFHRVRQGVVVSAAAWESWQGPVGARARHVVMMRALDAVSPHRPRFSHWSAGVARALPIEGHHLDRVHITVDEERLRGIDGVAAHLLPLGDSEVEEVRGLLITTPARTVLDVAGASPFRGGVMAADAALRRGLPRDLLRAAADLAGPRKAQRRIGDVIAFAHPGAESPGESEMRCSQFQIGIAPQELQREFWDGGRMIGRVDSWDEVRRIACEADGDQKYLDPEMAPDGVRPVLLREKRREDELRTHMRGMARFGYAEARNPALLRPILRRVGLLPEANRPTLSDHAAVAAAAVPTPFLSR